jgi:hypothetical protein
VEAMKIRKVILFISIFLLIISSYKATAPNLDYKNIGEKTNFENEKLWAIIITAGEPKRDNNNAVDLLNILKNHGWKEDNIFYLKENEATKDAILSVPDWLEANGAEEKDLILFYFSIHGGRKEDTPPLDEPDNLDEFIISFKQDEENNHILDEELSIMFEEIQSKNLVIIFEACFSGGMIDGINDLKKTGRIVITSTKEDESSYPIFLSKSWLFPFYLIRGLRGKADINCDGYITVEESFNYAKFYTIKRSVIYAYFLFIFHKALFIQHPQIYDGWPSEEDNEKEMILLKI